MAGFNKMEESNRFDVEDLDFGAWDSTLKGEQTLPSDTQTDDRQENTDYQDNSLAESESEDETSYFKVGSYQVDLVDGERGRGSFGVVYIGHHKDTKESIAVKKIYARNKDDAKDIMKEIRVLESIPHHENIVQMHQYHYIKKAYWICMEFCDLGDMQDYFRNEKTVSLESQSCLMLQSARGLWHLHHHNPPLVHRDIKPANIMLKNGPDGRPVVKITDFGLAKMVNLESQQARTAILSTHAGTPGFMSPEFFARTPYTKSVDIFALGLVFLAMVNFDPKKREKDLIPLFEDIREMKAVGQVMYENRCRGRSSPPLINDRSDDPPLLLKVKALIRDMAAEDSKQRIKVAEVLQRLEKINPPVPAPRRKASSPKKPIVNSPGDKPEDKPGVGYRLMKEAADEKWKEKGMDGRNRQLISMLEEDFQGLKPSDPDKPSESRPAPQETTMKQTEGTDLKRNRSTLKQKFACGDVVRLPQGFTVAGRGDKKFLEQRAMVSAHDKENNCITLEFATGLSHTMRADEVKQEDMAGQVIEDGDMVIICADRDKLRRLQNACGGYTSDMDNFLGKTGLVVQMYENNTARIQFSHDRRSWTLNTQAFKLLYKAEYLMQHYYQQ